MYTFQGSLISKEKLIIAFLLMFILLEAAWVPFRANKIKKKTEIKVISSTDLSLSLDVNVYGAEVKEIDTKKFTDIGKEVFALLKIENKQ